ncbi:MAG: hypothetical protein A3F84_12070 [Candidatus Handelsmanbacteria bacterium RIFCSPLOWO2_12_FULL_64_10]|uniref:D-serine dehydratase-like domain-containing protein n=1 Tax=Handelsmanbacteria sp. (strain RIFCSPLOWO2_12_FULL_64_10) TaxID=1817868 RepID=A0A1F6D7G2_HANXR|nr:MAG: hypothetical protein A3F84_12070 [Candidatus Handelsmanbacteria bacterium RIFCSPLOWO2_12_FULL_64_10]
MSPLIGKRKEELDTPVLLVDLDVMERNIAAMAAYMKRHGVAWRPHSKCHKTPAIVHLQIAAGALGVTCAKLSEAEVMAASGIRDILIANMLVTPEKARRLAALRRSADPIAAIDSPEGAEVLGAAATEAGVTIRAVPEVDIGLDRVGVDPGLPALHLARKIADTRGLALAGVMGYEGQTMMIPDAGEKERTIRAAIRLLTDTADLIRREGLPVPIVSASGTGTYQVAATCPGVTEMQAGGGVFMDRLYADKSHVTGLGYALTVLSTVVSRRRPGRAVVDAGFKTLSSQQGLPTPIGVEGAEVAYLSSEHGVLNLTGDAERLRVGDRIEFIPGYSDTTMFLHDEIVGTRDGRVEVVWEIQGRGKLL